MKYLVILLLITFTNLCKASNIQNGADQIKELSAIIKNRKIALVANQTSLVGNTHLLDTLCSLGKKPVALFAPEHGFRGNADAGETVRDGKDVKTGTPIISLYGKNKKPSAANMANIDLVIFDIQDVGARFYTYISTLYYVMQACAENKKELIVLDRPNPCDYVDGPILKKEYKSFVGMLPIPVLHGCTMGELAGMINGEGWLGNNLKCNFSVIKIKGWKHGTPKALEGFDKNPLHKNTECHGLDLRKTDTKTVNGFSLRYVLEMYNEFKKMNKIESFLTRPKWFDLLMGTNQVRLDMLKGKSEEEIRSVWIEDLNRYKEMRKKYILY